MSYFTMNYTEIQIKCVGEEGSMTEQNFRKPIHLMASFSKLN